MSSRTVIPAACSAVSDMLAQPPSTPLSSPTPCQDFDLKALVEHAAGTTGAMARLGLRQPLDPDNPWGGGEGAADQDWSALLQDNLATIARGWSRPEAWDGTVEAGETSMPAAMVGDMALVEVVLHGWDLARTLERDLVLGDDVAGEVRRAVDETAEMGRSMGAYGPAVDVPDGASDLEQALGGAGRDPGWSR